MVLPELQNARMPLRLIKLFSAFDRAQTRDRLTRKYACCNRYRMYITNKISGSKHSQNLANRSGSDSDDNAGSNLETANDPSRNLEFAINLESANVILY